MYGLELTITKKIIREHAVTVKGEQIEYYTSLPTGSAITEQRFTEMYQYGNYSIGVGKPGKEVFSNNIKYHSGLKGNNPHDMTPRIFLNGDLVMYDGSFEAIFKEFVRIHHSVEALEILGSLFYRNAYLLDHQKIDGRWLYNPPNEAIEILHMHCTDFLGLPVEVFLYYLELIASNEDTKYSTLGYNLSDGIGRKNNLLTYAHVIHIIIQKHKKTEGEFLLDFMSFAGRLTSPPAGLNPISDKKALETFIPLSS
jgi:hypothetical protein